MREEIKKTNEYLEYLREHYDNVQKAWRIIQEKGDGKGFDFLYDDFKFHTLDMEILVHDRSKLSKFEFVQYRKKFFPTQCEKENQQEKIKQEFTKAWEHHKANNNHHWEHWSKDAFIAHYPHDTGMVVHNVCDWMAMGFKFNDTAKDYYEKNKENIMIPGWSKELIYKIFDVIY